MPSFPNYLFLPKSLQLLFPILMKLRYQKLPEFCIQMPPLSSLTFSSMFFSSGCSFSLLLSSPDDILPDLCLTTPSNGLLFFSIIPFSLQIPWMAFLKPESPALFLFPTTQKRPKTVLLCLTSKKILLLSEGHFHHFTTVTKCKRIQNKLLFILT